MTGTIWCMDEVGLGRRLQEARQKAGLTQQQLCSKADLSYSTLAKIERGAIKSPSIFTISKIAEVLGVTLNNLLGISLPGSAAGTEDTAATSRSGIRFVFFDINGCLVRFFHHAFTKLAIDTGASSDTIESTFWHYNDDVCTGKLSLEDFNKELAQSLQVSSLDWRQYYLEAVTPIEDMHELASWVAEHYKVGLLSNIMPGFVAAMRESGQLPMIDYAAIVDSSEVGVIKPDPRIYEIATERAGVPPEQILLVDDSRPNLMAAEKMGWKVLWFDDYRLDDSIERVKSALKL